MLRVFITTCPYFLLKTAAVKLFGLLKILGRIATFYSYQALPLSFAKSLLTAVFQNIVAGLFLR